MKIQHPVFPDVVRDVADAEPWLAQGWVESPIILDDFLDELNAQRSAQITDKFDEVFPPACPTCGATGEEPCMTSTGNTTARHFAR